MRKRAIGVACVVLLCVVVCLSILQLRSVLAARTPRTARTPKQTMPLLGDPAPTFKAPSTKGPVNFPADYKGKWVVFFAHPEDFTPVCTTEIFAFASVTDKFKALNAELVGLSVNELADHRRWVKRIEAKVELKGVKNVTITFPIIADPEMRVARLYGMVHPEWANRQTSRAVFIVDPAGSVRAMLYYPGTTGRNVAEVLRILTGLQRFDKHGVKTPANWQPGDDVIIPVPEGAYSNDALRRPIKPVGEGYRCLDWYLCLGKDPGK